MDKQNRPDNLVSDAVALCASGDFESMSFEKYIDRYVVTVSVHRREVDDDGSDE